MTPEQRAQQEILLAAGGTGLWLARNNVGALKDANGRLVRYGLANESAEMNKRIKSGDLIGIRPLTVTAEMVGLTIGQFVSVEVKAPGWHYGGSPREAAQAAWRDHVRRFGGFAIFATGPDDLTIADAVSRLTLNLTGTTE